ncbi:hypothetical protein KCP77_16435 [Salmonella enterica subsp. enterica]|nr:hypothetical protein KCP77_16435 [Salmonella enterica subsp. enterica]
MPCKTKSLVSAIARIFHATFRIVCPPDAEKHRSGTIGREFHFIKNCGAGCPPGEPHYHSQYGSREIINHFLTDAPPQSVFTRWAAPMHPTKYKATNKCSIFIMTILSRNKMKLSSVTVLQDNTYSKLKRQ